MNANVEITKEISEIKINENKKIYITIKRIVDIIGGLVGCIILVPLTIGVWLANIISKNEGPVFLIQKRIGKDGKPFRMYKYRSMILGADRELKRYLKQNIEKNEEFIKYRKIKGDPRITPVGEFLRKTTLDEFPQFINVLKGEMSLVGPRPYLFREKRIIREVYNEIIKVKPGLTGPWQVAGRNERTLKERFVLDVKYVGNCCLKKDIEYFFKTFKKIFEKEGAI